jgi:hypothetical protein
MVVSYLADQHPPTPRAERTQVLLAEMAGEWESVLVSGPTLSAGGPTASGPGRSILRSISARFARSLLLDRYEPKSRRLLRRLPANIDGALLVGFPFSPVALAACRLAAAEIPYVIDAGDPWVLTATFRPNTAVGLRRARRAELHMWQHARAAILTTRLQAQALLGLFPHLRVMVRPNGYFPVSSPSPQARRPDRARSLRLVHFGSLSHVRLDVRSFLSGLSAGGDWERIELHLYGSDWTGVLSNLNLPVSVVAHQPQPWPVAAAEACAFDAALVIGNRDPAQLPSKAVAYLTLPIPRVAVVGSDADALAAYLADKPGWLVTDAGNPVVASAVAEHVRRDWAPEDLQPPPGEAWSRVAREIAAFVRSCLVSY